MSATTMLEEEYDEEDDYDEDSDVIVMTPKEKIVKCHNREKNRNWELHCCYRDLHRNRIAMRVYLRLLHQYILEDPIFDDIELYEKNEYKQNDRRQKNKEKKK